MKNIVVYTDKNESKLADVLAQIDDANVRIENAEFSSRKSFEQDIHREVSGQDCRVCQYDFG